MMLIGWLLLIVFGTWCAWEYREQIKHNTLVQEIERWLRDTDRG